MFAIYPLTFNEDSPGDYFSYTRLDDNNDSFCAFEHSNRYEQPVNNSICNAEMLMNRSSQS